MLDAELKQLIKENAIRLADHHRGHCDGAECNISLYLLGRTLSLAGIALTDGERLKFM